jgi:hypothetical protein
LRGLHRGTFMLRVLVILALAMAIPHPTAK